MVDGSIASFWHTLTTGDAYNMASSEMKLNAITTNKQV